MVRPLKGQSPLDQRLHILLATDELEAVDDWRFARRIGSRSEAIRQLIAHGLQAIAAAPGPAPDSKPKRQRKSP